MKTHDDTDFEAWASLLINRKTPADYRHLIARELIGEGAEILRKGAAFEVHLDSAAHSPTETTQTTASQLLKVKEIVGL